MDDQENAQHNDLMPPLTPVFHRAAIVSDDPFLAARLSCALAKRGTYLAILDGPRMTRPDSGAEVTRRNNALARVSPKTTLLAGLSVEASAAMVQNLPKGHPHEVTDGDVPALILNEKVKKNAPLKCGRDRIGASLLRAMYEERMIEFVDDAPTGAPVKSPSDYLVVCEAGEPLSEVIAANYAFALNAGLQVIDPTDEVERKELLEAYYSIDEPGKNPGQIRETLQTRLRDLCQGVDLPPNGSLTFVTKGLPFGVAFAELPSTHLFSSPDLGIAIQPRILGIVIKPIPLAAGGNAYVIDIPQATTLAPHQAGHRYYRRYNFQSVPMEDYEVKDAMQRASSSEPFIYFTISRFQNPDGTDRVHLCARIGNRSAEPMLYASIKIILGQSFFSGQHPNVQGWTSAEGVLSTGNEGFQPVVQIYSSNHSIPGSMPIFKETEFVLFNVELAHPDVGHYYLGYEIACPGYAYDLIGPVLFDGDTFSPLSEETSLLVRALETLPR